VKVLILSSPDDAHAVSVSKHLHEMKIPVDYLLLKEFINPFSYEIGTDRKVCRLDNAANSLDLFSYSAIWHRRPGKLPSQQFVEPWIGTMVEQETRSTVQAIWKTLVCTWVNSPFNDAAAVHKLWQLEMAQKLGLQVPKTLVTNQMHLVREFYERCRSKVIYKLISEQTVFSIPMTERPTGFGTLQLRGEDIEHLDQVKYSPHLFQEMVEKDFELRVTLVGEKIFCVRIDSQSGKGKLDWREDYSVPMYPFELPESISRKCFELMKHLGLNYAAADFIVTPKQEYVFLEINCGGQFLWVERITGLPISEALAKLLAGQSEPLCK
jgi:glutathione synthase/RimK-type ligase-like ATP-grasp enzyme